LAGVLALLAVSMAIPASAVSVSATRTRWVDDDGKAGPHGCGGSKAATKRIRTAINKSDKNDVVIVCPGTYSEEIGIVGSRLAGLTLRAYTKGTAIIKTPNSVTYGPPIWVERVKDVTVQGLTFEFPSTGCDPRSGDVQGMWIEDADGIRVLGNRFRTTGTDTQGSCGYDDGILIHDSTSFRIANNTIRDFKSDGISVEQGARGKVDGNTVQFYHAASASDDDGDQGIRIIGGARAEVTGNVVRSLSGANHPHLELGIAIQGAANDTYVHHNDVHSVKQGIGVLGVRAKVSYNDVIGVGDGGSSGVFADEDATGTQILSNKVSAFDYGLWVDGSGITLRHNDARSSITNSCVDTSTGGGTADTANTWSSSNIGTPASDPAGICRVP
jgi:parallel beta-helix repeat protein